MIAHRHVTRRPARFVALIGLVTVTVVLASTAALAKSNPNPNPNQPPPPPPMATLKLTPGSGNPGATISALVTCTQPTEAISIFMIGVPASTPGAQPIQGGTGDDVLLFNQTFNPAKPAGPTNATFMIPAGLPAGTWGVVGACLYANDFQGFGTTLIVPKKIFPPFGWGSLFSNLLFEGNIQLQGYFLGATGALAPPPPAPPPPTTTTTTTAPHRTITTRPHVVPTTLPTTTSTTCRPSFTHVGTC